MPSTSKCKGPNQPISETLPVLLPVVEPRSIRVWKNKTPFQTHEDYNRLPGHLVGLVALSQAEGAGQVAGEHVDLLDVGDQSLVNSLLVRRAGAVDLLLL